MSGGIGRRRESSGCDVAAVKIMSPTPMTMRPLRPGALALALASASVGASVDASASAQQVPPDSSRADSARALQAVTVSVTRSDARIVRLPWAIGVQTRDDIRRGQATVGVEILDDWPEVDTIVVPIGGGGLIAGIGLWAKAVKPDLRLIGVQPAASPPMYAHLETGSTEPMPIAPTIADGVAGNIERTSITWKLCRKLVDEVVLVEEDAITAAMRWALEVQHILLEGSAALGIAALQPGILDTTDRRVTVVTTGRNVTAETLRGLLS